MSTSHEKTSSPPDLALIMSDIAELRNDIAGLTRNLTKEIADTMSARGGRAAHVVGQQLAEQPLIGLAVAFGVGFLGSRLLLR